MSWKSGSLNLLEPSGPHPACYGTLYLLNSRKAKVIGHIWHRNYTYILKHVVDGKENISDGKTRKNM
jgi:hypothetical protein